MTPTAQPARLPDADGLRILVLDDYELARTLMVRVLSAQGYQVVGAAGAVDAIKRTTTERFDLVIIDIEIPGGGVAVARRAVATNPGLRVLFLSSSPTSSRDFGIIDARLGFLQTPVDIDALSAAVRGLLLSSTY